MIGLVAMWTARAAVRAAWFIAQVQWYGLGDALKLIGIGLVIGGVVVGMIVWLVKDMRRS